jgi:acyl-CoA reductase-like NAD-dependent aldehyde dehydrogenase
VPSLTLISSAEIRAWSGTHAKRPAQPNGDPRAWRRVGYRRCLLESPDVRAINLIGGVKTAKMLAKRAGETLKRTTMELGGYNPMIILDDVDMDYAVRTATFGSFFHQGQICLNTRRIIIQRKIADEFLEKFAARTKTLPSGDPQDHKTIIGPLITPAAVKLVDDRVREAVAKGAKLHTGGVFEGQIYQRTILSNVPLDTAVANEETFGPVVVVEVVDTPEQAVEAANRTMYGLLHPSWQATPIGRLSWRQRFWPASSTSTPRP